MENLNLPDPKMMDVAVPINLNLGINYNKQKANNGIVPTEFNKIIKDKRSVLIDLREQIEINKEGVIIDSISVCFPKIREYLKKNKEILDDKIILFYCAHGHRSTLAIQMAKSLQLSNCFHLIGGVKNWKNKIFSL